MTVSSDHARSQAAPAVQVRRAWLVLAMASLTFALLVGGLFAGANWVYRNATEPETATLTIVSGTGALIRSPGNVDWRLVTEDVKVREGDRVSTALGTVVTLSLFDGSTVEVTEDTIVRIARMRSSRFLERTKLVVLEPERGTIYVGMAPRGDYSISEISTRIGDLQVTMGDEPGRPESGAYLVEIRDDPPDADLTEQTVRIAVLHGAANVTRGDEVTRLEANQQTLVKPAGPFGDVTTIVQELIVNGDFSHGLSGWIEFEQNSQQFAGKSEGTLVELVQDETTLGEGVVVEMIKAGEWDNVARVGIRQRIGKTLRVHTSLLLSFETRIVSQKPSAVEGDETEFPLVIQIDYVDVDGHDQSWIHGYYAVEDGEQGRHIPLQVATKVDLDRWQRIFFDLRGISPLPRQITSIVVYASGENYQTRVANVSLTTSELAGAEQ
jgi:hypothetical protein